MKKEITTILLCVCSLVHGAELNLICEDDTAAWFHTESSNAGIDMFSVDAAAGQVRQISGLHMDKKMLAVDVTEAEIRFSQSGHINVPGLAETFNTTISRISGKWTRHPHYLDGDGQWIQGLALEQLARSVNMWGFFGVQQKSSNGTCRVDDRKF